MHLFKRSMLDGLDGRQAEHPFRDRCQHARRFDAGSGIEARLDRELSGTQFSDMLMTGFAWTPDGKLLACTRGALVRDAVLVTDLK